MTDFEYMEKYGENPNEEWAFDYDDERLEKLEKCVERIKEVTSDEILNELSLEEVLEEIKECVESL